MSHWEAKWDLNERDFWLFRIFPLSFLDLGLVEMEKHWPMPRWQVTPGIPPPEIYRPLQSYA
jgi:hypothetical protein